jgi:hypothetical protein
MACFQPLLLRGGECVRYATIFGDQKEARPRDRGEDNRSILAPVRATLARCIGKCDRRASAHREQAVSGAVAVELAVVQHDRGRIVHARVTIQRKAG